MTHEQLIEKATDFWNDVNHFDKSQTAIMADFALSVTADLAAQLKDASQFAAYCRSCALSGEANVQTFGEFVNYRQTSKIEMGTRADFACPNCGSSHFGSMGSDENQTISCNDQFNKGCRWSARRFDAEYFSPTDETVCGHGYNPEYCPIHKERNA